MALGAQRFEVLRLVLRRGMVLALVGLALGVPATLAVSRLIRGFVYGVSPVDPYSIGAAGLSLLIVAGLATFFPARRATKIDPIVALRCE